jgi:hypothetical protein
VLLLLTNTNARRACRCCDTTVYAASASLLLSLLLFLLKLLPTHPKSSYVYGLIASATCTSSHTAVVGERDAPCGHSHKNRMIDNQ